MTEPTDNVSRLARIAKTMEAGHWHSSAKVVREAADEIERLRKERNEARREVCYLTAELDMINHTSVTAKSIALEYEWDCFKEEADHNNNYFKTHHK